MATLNAGRMGVSPADMTIQPKRKECLSPLATLPGKVSEHSVGQFSEAADAEEGPLIGLRKAGDFSGLTFENCLKCIS
jgi:hypothetical protein